MNHLIDYWKELSPNDKLHSLFNFMFFLTLFIRSPLVSSAAYLCWFVFLLRSFRADRSAFSHIFYGAMMLFVAVVFCLNLYIQL